MSADNQGREMTIESEEGSFGAYLATPATGQGPGILVLQEWWGLVLQIRGVCDRLARSGYVALAPDLYRGESTGDPEEAGRLMMELEIPRAGRDLVQAASVLRSQPAVTGAKLGCLGFCMGGQLALYAACLEPSIGAVVDCYGVHPNVSLDLGSFSAAVLGVFAENDEFVSSDDVSKLTGALEEAKVRHQIRTYAAAQHAFLNEARPDVFDADQAALAWRDIETFLAAELQ